MPRGFTIRPGAWIAQHKVQSFHVTTPRRAGGIISAACLARSAGDELDRKEKARAKNAPLAAGSAWALSGPTHRLQDIPDPWVTLPAIGEGYRPPAPVAVNPKLLALEQTAAMQ